MEVELDPAGKDRKGKDHLSLNSPILLMSTIRLPKVVTDELNRIQRNFWWGYNDQGKDLT